MEDEHNNKLWSPGHGPLPAPPEPPKNTSLLSDSTHAAINHTSYNFTKTFIDGLNQLSVIPAILFDGTIRSTYSQALTRNLTYLALAIASSYLETYSKKYTDDYVPHPDIVGTALTVGFLTVNTLIFTRFLISSSVDNMSIAAAVRKQSLPHLDKHKCDCDMNLSIPGILDDPFTNMFGAFRMFKLGLMPLILPYIGHVPPAIYGSIFYGSGLIHLRLSQCLEHKREYVKNHLFSTMGYGASFLALTQLFYHMLRTFSGTDNFIMYDAVFTLMYQIYIVHSLMEGVDFPEDVIRLDPAYFDYRAVQAYLPDFQPRIKKMLDGEKQNSFIIDLIHPLVASRFIRHWTSLDIRSLDKVLNNPSNKLWIQMHHPKAMRAIDELLDIPRNSGLKVGKRLESWLGRFGVHFDALDLARTVWNLSKEGYFSPEFLEKIRNSINNAAGVTPEVRRPQTSKKTRVEVILDEPDVTIIPENNDSTSSAADTQKPRRRVAVLSNERITVNENYVEGGIGGTEKVIYHRQPSAVRKTARGEKVFAQTTTHANPLADRTISGRPSAQ